VAQGGPSFLVEFLPTHLSPAHHVLPLSPFSSISSGSRRAGEGTLPCLSGGRARRSSGMLGGLRREAGERLSGPRTLIFAQQACSIATDSISPDRFELPRHQINQHGHRIELHNHQIAFHSHRIDIRRCRLRPAATGSSWGCGVGERGLSTTSSSSSSKAK
jgi:hypothetical protein